MACCLAVGMLVGYARPDNTPWASRARLADTLAAALEAQVPDRHLVLRDGG